MTVWEHLYHSGGPSKWEQVCLFFNSKKNGKLFTRNEFMLAMDWEAQNGGHSFDTTLDTYRTYLTRAGYLVEFEPGVYRKSKKIPYSLTSTQCYKEAYGSK